MGLGELVLGRAEPAPCDLASVDSKQSGVSCPGLSNTKNYSPRAVTETAVQTESMYLLGSWGRVTFPKGHLGTHLPDGGAAVVGALKASPAGLVLADFKQTLQSPWAEPLPAGTVIY